jgi:heme/copper-type cytochrome/quinol oxidase subunit 2
VRPSFIADYLSPKVEQLVFGALIARGDRTWTGKTVIDATWTIVVSMGTQISADFTIAAASFYHLRKYRTRSNHKSTRKSINKLIFCTLGTCLVPTLFAIIRLILVKTAQLNSE